MEKSGYSGRWQIIPGRLPSVFKCWEHRPSLVPAVTKKRKLNKLQQRETTCTSNAIADKDIEDVDQIEIEPCPQTEPIDEANNEMTLEDTISQLKAEVITLTEQLRAAELKTERLEKAASEMEFSIQNIADQDVCFFTGFPNRQVFDEMLTYLNVGSNGENLVYIRNEAKDDLNANLGKKRGRKRKLSPSNQLFLFLCRVRLGLFELDLAYRFNISMSTVSNIIISWFNFLYLRLGSLCIWPSKEQVIETMPESFKAKYPNTRVIIDATEIKVEMPSSLVFKSQTYSNYKSADTLKGLIGISPSGSITFISQLYTAIQGLSLTGR